MIGHYHIPSNNPRIRLTPSINNTFMHSRIRQGGAASPLPAVRPPPTVRTPTGGAASPLPVIRNTNRHKQYDRRISRFYNNRITRWILALIHCYGQRGRCPSRARLHNGRVAVLGDRLPSLRGQRGRCPSQARLHSGRVAVLGDRLPTRYGQRGRCPSRIRPNTGRRCPSRSVLKDV